MTVGPPAGPDGPPPPSRSAPPPPTRPKLPLVVGALAGAVTPVFFSVVPFVVTNGATVAGYGLLAWLLVPLVGLGLLLAPGTRRWGAGVLIGFFGLLIIGAGACVALLVAFNATGGPG